MHEQINNNNQFQLRVCPVCDIPGNNADQRTKRSQTFQDLFGTLRFVFVNLIKWKWKWKWKVNV